MSLLEVKELKTYFYTDAGCAKAPARQYFT